MLFNFSLLGIMHPFQRNIILRKWDLLITYKLNFNFFELLYIRIKISCKEKMIWYASRLWDLDLVYPSLSLISFFFWIYFFDILYIFHTFSCNFYYVCLNLFFLPDRKNKLQYIGKRIIFLKFFFSWYIYIFLFLIFLH